MLLNSKCMLVYGFTSEEKLKLDDIIKENLLPTYRIITEDMGNMKISQLLAGETIISATSKMPKEKLILFNDFDENMLDLVVKKLKSKFSIMPILAVITETSVNWTLKELTEHLIEEREWYRKNQTVKA